MCIISKVLLTFQTKTQELWFYFIMAFKEISARLWAEVGESSICYARGEEDTFLASLFW